MNTVTSDLSSLPPVADYPDASEAVDLSPYKILLFHKETEKVNSLRSILRWCGLQDMTVAMDLKNAIRHIISDKFDLIFVTHVGEGEETSQFIEELKNLDATSDIPLIAITTDGEVKKMLRVLAMGVDEVIATPLSREMVEDAAARILQSRLGLSPVKVRVDSAEELIEAGQFEAAQEIYLELLTEGKFLVDVHLGLCRTCCLTQQWRDAEVHLKQALELAKSTRGKVESHVHLARVFFNYGNYNKERDRIEKAIKCYQASLSLNPFHIENLKALLGLLQKKNDEEAISKIVGEVCANFLPYSRATEEIALCLSEMAQRFVDLNMAAQGRRIYEQLLEFPHGNVDVHMKVADFFLAEGLASQVLERLITLLQKLKDSDILFKTGDILLDIQKRYLSSGATSEKTGVDLSFFKRIGSDEVLSMAEKMFKQGLLLEPDSLRFSLGLARCCIRQNEAKAAADILDRLHEMYGEDAQAFQEVIDALLTEGAYDRAVEWIKSAISRFPREISFYVLYARYYDEQKRYYDAIGCLKRALTLEPSHAGCIVSLAGLYEEIKEYSDAIVYYEKAIKLLPRDPTLQEKLRKILNLKFK